MKHKVIISRRADEMLVEHVRFLAQVSIAAAKILRNEVACVLKSLEDNPCLHQWEVDVNLPAGTYRRVVFAKRYKAFFLISEDTVYVAAIVGFRQEYRFD